MTTAPENAGGDEQGPDKLHKALEAERAAHKESKAKQREFRAALTERLGISVDAGTEEVFAALDPGKQVAAKTATLQRERDAAVERADRVAAEWDAHRIDAALSAALAASGMIPANGEDARNLMRPLFEVTGKGEVRTKEAPNTVPGMAPDQWILGQLRAIRPHWWPASIGGGARGGTGTSGLPGEPEVFDPRSPKFNITAQHQYHRRYGPEAARRAMARFGGGR